MLTPSTLAPQTFRYFSDIFPNSPFSRNTQVGSTSHYPELWNALRTESLVADDRKLASIILRCLYSIQTLPLDSDTGFAADTRPRSDRGFGWTEEVCTSLLWSCSTFLIEMESRDPCHDEDEEGHARRVSHQPH